MSPEEIERFCNRMDSFLNQEINEFCLDKDLHFDLRIRAIERMYIVTMINAGLGYMIIDKESYSETLKEIRKSISKSTSNVENVVKKNLKSSYETLMENISKNPDGGQIDLVIKDC